MQAIAVKLVRYAIRCVELQVFKSRQRMGSRSEFCQSEPSRQLHAQSHRGVWPDSYAGAADRTAFLPISHSSCSVCPVRPSARLTRQAWTTDCCFASAKAETGCLACRSQRKQL